MNNKLEELLNKTNSNALNYDVNSDNLYLYAAITEPKSINKESLINFLEITYINQIKRVII